MPHNSEDQIWVYVDSNQRTSGTNENFSITLTTPISRVRRVRITDIQIPRTYYTIGANNNQLNFNITDAVNPLIIFPYSVFIDPGNYTSTELATEIGSKMNTAVNYGFIITYNAKTLKYNWSTTPPFPLPPPTFTILASGTISHFIGITADNTGFTIDSQGAIDIGGPNYFFIKSDQLLRPKIYKPVDNIITDNILYKVPIAAGESGSIITDKNIETDFALKYGIHQTFETIDFKLEDPDGNTVDLNQTNWSFTLVLELN
jgi:hypothetical protein